MNTENNSDDSSLQRRKIIEKYDLGVGKKNAEEWENPQYSISAITDYYGFIHDDGLTDQFLEKENKIKKLDTKRESKWRKLLDKKVSKKKNTSTTMIIGSNPFGDIIIRMKDSSFREELTKRIYKGVPQKFKAPLWHVFLDTVSIKQSKPHVYEAMLQKALSKSPDIHQIDLDVNRTFRNTTYFRERYNGRQKALMHVLAAYSMYNTEIGYCQGMSEIAGLLLMYLVEEEDVFWGLSQLMTLPRFSMHGVFVAGFPRLLTFFNHLTTITQKLLPKISRHFEKLDLFVSSYALKWFMQCYLDRVPLTLFLRLWDIYLLEGEKLLIAMAYNILKMHKKRLLKMDHSSILYFLQNELRKDFHYDDDIVIESLKLCIEELKRYKLSVPLPPKDEELPTRPFGADYDTSMPSPSVVKQRQAVQANPEESIRKSLKRRPKLSKDQLASNSHHNSIASTNNTPIESNINNSNISNVNISTPATTETNSVRQPVKYRIQNNSTNHTSNQSLSQNKSNHYNHNVQRRSRDSQLPKSNSLYLPDSKVDDSKINTIMKSSSINDLDTN